MPNFKIDSYFDTTGIIMNNTCEYDIYNKINRLTINNFGNAIRNIKRQYFSENQSTEEPLATRELIINFNERNMRCAQETYGDDMLEIMYCPSTSFVSNGIRYFENIFVTIYNDNRPVEIRIGVYIGLEEDDSILSDDFYEESSYFDTEGIKSENHFFPKGNCLSDYKLIVRVNEY
jgi:hypothetical protein